MHKDQLLLQRIREHVAAAGELGSPRAVAVPGVPPSQLWQHALYLVEAGQIDGVALQTDDGHRVAVAKRLTPRGEQAMLDAAHGVPDTTAVAPPAGALRGISTKLSEIGWQAVAAVIVAAALGWLGLA